MAHTDYEVGRVIERIKELGQEDNTLVILMIGDNGASGEGKPWWLWLLETPIWERREGGHGYNRLMITFVVSSRQVPSKVWPMR